MDELKVELRKYNQLLLDVLNSIPYQKGFPEAKTTKRDLEKKVQDLKFKIQFEDARLARESKYRTERLLRPIQNIPIPVVQRPVKRRVVRK